MLTLTELRAQHPERFYRQDWFLGEAFMNYYANGLTALPRVARSGDVPDPHEILPRAVDLAYAFVNNPDAHCWQRYWWCADVDAKGQRVYVGGACEKNGFRFEIHRHLQVTNQWAIAA